MIDVKGIREALCVAQVVVSHRGGILADASHAPRLAAGIRALDELRPLGPDGKHGDRHTPWCGCADVDPAREQLVAAVRAAHRQGPMLVSSCPRCRKVTGPDCGHPWHSGSGSWGCACGWEQDAPHVEHVADMLERALFAYDQQHTDVEQLPVGPFVDAMEFLHGQGVPRPPVPAQPEVVRPTEQIQMYLDTTPPGWQQVEVPGVAAIVVNGVRYTPDSPTLIDRVRARARREIAEARMIVRWLGSLPHRQHNREARTDEQH